MALSSHGVVQGKGTNDGTKLPNRKIGEKAAVPSFLETRNDGSDLSEERNTIPGAALCARAKNGEVP
jgi:hypothetical protein